MNCPKCGVELLEHVSFCPLCGSALPDDLWKKKTTRTQAPKAKRKPVKKAKPKTVTMRPTEPEPEKPKTVTMKPVEEKPKTVTMRPTEPTPPAPEPAAAPGRPPAEAVEEPAPPAEGPKAPEEPAPPAEAAPSVEAAPPAPVEEKPPSGETVDMLCPMCDTIVSIPVERPIHVKCPKCAEEYYFAK